MKITQLPPIPAAAATDEVTQPPANTAPPTANPAGDTTEPSWQGLGTFDTKLDAQMQKARVANLFALPFQALPNAVNAGVQLFKSPDANLRTPKPADLAKLNDELKAAVKKAESGKEDDRAAVDVILKKIVAAYGIGQNGVSMVEFDPKSSDQGDTIGSNPKTAITVGKPGLDSAEEAASTILHESNHVRRNKELDNLGIDRDKFGPKAETIYSALSEVEGYQLEINNAKKLGTSADYVKGAEGLKKHYLHELELAGAGKDIIALAEKGKFDEAFKKFRHDVLKQ
jgi:hypothetical protein